MSENLDLVRSICSAWARGDFAASDWADPEVESGWADGPAPGSRIGVAAMAESEREFLNAWEDVRLAIGEYREVDGQRVLVFIHASGRGKTSGLDLAQLSKAAACLFEIRDGKVIRLVNYWNRDRALADLGLSD
jgi:ketosteroid isomerase-like protein